MPTLQGSTCNVTDRRAVSPVTARELEATPGAFTVMPRSRGTGAVSKRGAIIVRDTASLVNDLLGRLAAASGVPAESPPQEIIVSSLDQMRFLVGLEQSLNVVLDNGDVLLPFDLTSRDALVKSVEALLADSAIGL